MQFELCVDGKCFCSKYFLFLVDNILCIEFRSNLETFDKIVGFGYLKEEFVYIP